MKYIKTYENYKDSSDWKVGDIVYATNGTFDFQLMKDEPYEIVEIITRGYVQLKTENPEIFPINVKDRNGTIVQGIFSRQNFITEEEWKFNNDTKKYNL